MKHTRLRPPFGTKAACTTPAAFVAALLVGALLSMPQTAAGEPFEKLDDIAWLTLLLGEEQTLLVSPELGIDADDDGDGGRFGMALALYHRLTRGTFAQLDSDFTIPWSHSDGAELAGGQHRSRLLLGVIDRSSDWGFDLGHELRVRHGDRLGMGVRSTREGGGPSILIDSDFLLAPKVWSSPLFWSFPVRYELGIGGYRRSEVELGVLSSMRHRVSVAVAMDVRDGTFDDGKIELVGVGWTHDAVDVRDATGEHRASSDWLELQLLRYEHMLAVFDDFAMQGYLELGGSIFLDDPTGAAARGGVGVDLRGPPHSGWAFGVAYVAEPSDTARGERRGFDSRIETQLELNTEPFGPAFPVHAYLDGSFAGVWFSSLSDTQSWSEDGRLFGEVELYGRWRVDPSLAIEFGANYLGRISPARDAQSYPAPLRSDNRIGGFIRVPMAF